MKALLHRKDSEALCPYCLDILFVISEDIYEGDLFSTTKIYQDKGQAPWRKNERLICRKCNTAVGVSDIKVIPFWRDEK